MHLVHVQAVISKGALDELVQGTGGLGLGAGGVGLLSVLKSKGLLNVLKREHGPQGPGRGSALAESSKPSVGGPSGLRQPLLAARPPDAATL